MPRGKKTDGAGHNSAGAAVEITDDERAALSQHHQLKIREARRAAEKIKAQYDEAREVVNERFALCKGDLGYSRKQFEELLALGDMTEAQFQAAERARTGRILEAGLKPEGTQLDLALGDTVDDKIGAEADGYRAGRRGDDPTPPDNIAPFLHPDWTSGWHRGQGVTGELMIKAAEILAARKKPTVALELEEPEEEGDEDDDLDEAALALAESGWTKPTADEAAFETEAA